ncbi:hypothetical protein [Streptomyces sp. Inha503]|uniref:hypothetical protein n=1 Tax=Streptomyces sp. Inha503 TaxID=3383314 RepID=UPI00399F23B4
MPDRAARSGVGDHGGHHRSQVAQVADHHVHALLGESACPGPLGARTMARTPWPDDSKA